MENINIQIEDIINKYINFVKYCVYCKYNTTITFYPINDNYYLFYNKDSSINANDIDIRFEKDGKFEYGNNIYYYVGFEKKNIYNYLTNIKKYDILILDENFSVIEFRKRNKLENFGKEIDNFLTKISIYFDNKKTDKLDDFKKGVLNDSKIENSNDDDNNEYDIIEM
jgi:hypothetical protein